MIACGAPPVYEQGKLFSEHRHTLTLLDTALRPSTADLRWLDLCCGRGQILNNLNDGLPPEFINRIDYVGYDAEPAIIEDAKNTAAELTLRSSRFFIGDISKFKDFLPPGSEYDFVTCLNTVHEVLPAGLIDILINGILILSPNGSLHVYDLESLSDLELGAIPLQRYEVQEILSEFQRLTDSNNLFVASFPHSTCSGWSFTITRNQIGFPNPRIQTEEEQIRKALTDKVEDLLQRRLQDCRLRLEAYCKDKKNPREKRGEVTQALNEYWALLRALKEPM